MNTTTATSKSCVSNGRPACAQGFVRDKCQKCTMGSVRCNMCHTSSSSCSSPSSPRNSLSSDRVSSQPSSPTSSTFSSSSSSSSSSCIFCHNGRKACDDCFGLGYVQRICLDCIKDKHRRHRHIRKPSLPMSLSLSKPSVPAKETPQDNNSDSESTSSISSDHKRTKSAFGSTILRKLKVPALFSHNNKGKTHGRRWSLSSLSSRSLPSSVTAA